MTSTTTTNIHPTTATSSLSPTYTWVVGAAALTHVLYPVNRTTNTHILLLKRAANEDSFAGHWELPDGKIEVTDANVEAALARELLEETGLKLTRMSKRLGDMTWTGESGKSSVQSNYVVEVEGDLDLSEEHEEWRWVEVDELEELKMSREMRGVVRESLWAKA